MPKRATIARALKVLSEGTSGLPLSRAYRKTLRDRVRGARQPMSTAKAICRDLRRVHAERLQQEVKRPDISSAQESRVAQIRRPPGFLQSRAADEDKIRAATSKLLRGDMTQATFDSHMAQLAEAPLPLWMQQVEPPTTELHPRPSARMRHGPEGRDPFPAEWLEIPPAFDRRRRAMFVPSTEAA